MDNRYENYVSVYVSDDEMSVDIFIIEAPEPDFYNVEELVQYVESQGIRFGIKRDILQKVIDDKQYGQFIHFAEGIEPGEPANGHFDFKFNTSPSKKPKLKEDGSVDYYNLNLVETVEKDALVAEYVPKKDGTDGTKVTGEIIRGQKAKDIPALRGKGFYMSEDQKFYYAEKAGKVELSMGQLTISAMHTVSGNVDLSTGNIDFKGDLVITGNIDSEMKVRATGNITVEGLIEAANVEAGRDLLVKGGILGRGKSVIKAGGNIYAQFIENAKVESNSCVQADSIINSTVVAYSDINVFGKTSCIIGGSIKANRYIRTKVIGSDKGVNTVLEVGVTSDCYTERKRYSEQIEQQEKELEKIEKLLEKLADSEKMNDIVLQATRKKIELSAEIHRTRAILKEFEGRLAMGKNAEITAEKKIHPGVRIIIDGIKYDVNEDYNNIVFFRKMDQIVSKRVADN